MLLAVGRFVAKKGPLYTLRAFQLCLQRSNVSSAAQLWMVGDGPLLANAQRFVAQNAMQDKVVFAGVCSQELVAERMRQVRAFVQHSLVAPDGDSEGSPVAVMEAQLSGLPVIATRHAGIPDVVLDGQTGLLVEEGDVEAMAEAMQTLLEDSQKAQRFGQEGRRRVLNNFTVEHHLRGVTELLVRVHSAALLSR